VPKAPPKPVPIERKPRADAQRNRARILEVARLAFTQHGAATTMDEIAQQAGIGSGTLYRHFPNRDVLIEAVYRSEVEKLTAAAERYSARKPPLEALRAWMLLFIDHVAAKWLILPAMESVVGGSKRLIEGQRGHIHGTFAGLVRRAMENGDLRAETVPEDFLRALVGVFHTTAQPGWEPSARRIVDLLIAGARAPETRRAGKKLNKPDNA
jgi:AcrR family transcriptional regulator